jgi:hypothetical protein
MSIRGWPLYVTVVLIVSLSTWIFFYLQDLPLDPGSTLIVVVGWALIMGLGWYLVTQYRRLSITKRILAGLVLLAAALGLTYILLASAMINVTFPLKGPPLRVETGREILYTSQAERGGYALYSYVLFRGATTPQNEDRYLAALTAFHEEIPEIKELIRSHAQRSELNIAYILLKDPTPQAASHLLVKDVPRDWLGEYDFARAHLFLRVVPGATRDGPYIISYDRPLSGIENEVGRADLLLQDLSWVPASLVRVWVKEFLRQASQPGAFAKEDLWRQLTLKTRTGIEVAAQGLPEVEKAWADAKEKWDTAVTPVKPVKPEANKK